MADWDEGATVRLAATIARGRYAVDCGTMIEGVYPDTLVEMSLAAKREVDSLRADLARAEATIAKLREAMPTNEEMPILKRLHRYHWKRATDGGKHPPKSAAEEVDLLDVGRILDRLDAAKEGR